MKHQRTLIVAAALAVVGGSLAGCSSGSSSTGASASSGANVQLPTNLLGTWTGQYLFPLGTSGQPSADPATEKLVIQKQQGQAVWGIDEYTNNGKLIQDPVRGSIDAGNAAMTLTEQGGFFRITPGQNGALLARFTRTDSQFTSFEVTLTVSSSTSPTATPSAS